MFLPLHDINAKLYIPVAYVNYGLIALNCLVFLIQFALPAQANEEVILAFAIVPAILTGAVGFDPLPWLPDQVTLVTYAFLHADWLHLLSNMLFLWIFGDNVEDALGHWRYLAFYLACAVLAGLAHVLMTSDAGAVAPLIGASGAVAGVMGAYIVLYPHAKVFVLIKIIIPIPLPIPALWMLGVWIGTQLFYALVAPDEPVAWWAHLGGIAAGAALAVIMRRKEVPLFGGR